MSFQPTEDFKMSGAFAPVVLLHGTAGSAEDWTFLKEYLAGRFPIVAAEATDAETVEDIITSQDQPVHLVGQDIGAIMALRMATLHPSSVRSLSLIDPPCGPEGPSTALRDLQGTVNASAREGDAMQIARAHIDFWNGKGAFDRSSHDFRTRIARRAGQITSDLARVELLCPAAEDLATVGCPAQVITGSAARSEVQSAARSLALAIPFLRHDVIAGACHHAEMTDPHLVHPSIGDFLVRVDTWWHHTENRISAAA